MIIGRRGRGNTTAVCDILFNNGGGDDLHQSRGECFYLSFDVQGGKRKIGVE